MVVAVLRMEKESAYQRLSAFLVLKDYKLLLERPITRETTNKIKNKMKRILAMPAAPAAIPPNPKMAAIMATIKKITVQRNITLRFRVN